MTSECDWNVCDVTQVHVLWLSHMWWLFHFCCWQWFYLVPDSDPLGPGFTAARLIHLWRDSCTRTMTCSNRVTHLFLFWTMVSSDRVPDPLGPGICYMNIHLYICIYIWMYTHKYMYIYIHIIILTMVLVSSDRVPHPLDPGFTAPRSGLVGDIAQ